MSRITLPGESLCPRVSSKYCFLISASAVRRLALRVQNVVFEKNNITRDRIFSLRKQSLRLREVYARYCNVAGIHEATGIINKQSRKKRSLRDQRNFASCNLSSVFFLLSPRRLLDCELILFREERRRRKKMKEERAGERNKKFFSI